MVCEGRANLDAPAEARDQDRNETLPHPHEADRRHGVCSEYAPLPRPARKVPETVPIANGSDSPGSEIKGVTYSTGEKLIVVMHIITDLHTGGAEISLCRLLETSSGKHRVISLMPGGALMPRLLARGIPVEDIGNATGTAYARRGPRPGMGDPTDPTESRNGLDVSRQHRSYAGPAGHTHARGAARVGHSALAPRHQRGQAPDPAPDPS